MKKFVLKLNLYDDKEKRKALKTVSALSGIDSISMDMKDKTLTVIGTVDPISVVNKLRKFWPTDIIHVGPAKEPKKKEEAKPKKEEKKKESEAVIGIMPYRPYYRPINMYYHVHHSMEEDPNACIIC